MHCGRKRLTKLSTGRGELIRKGYKKVDEHSGGNRRADYKFWNEQGKELGNVSKKKVRLETE